MTKRNVQVIVVRCQKHEKDGWSTYGDRLYDTKFPTLEEAMTFGGVSTGKGRCVIVRPCYNEEDEFGKGFFREWRSFDGQPLGEIRWSFDF